jgi:transposase InsO family protein
MLHRNARTAVRVRIELCRMIEAGMPVARAAARCGTSRTTAYKWLKRWRAGDRQLLDRSSRPRRMPRLTPPKVAQLVLEARAATGLGPAMLCGYLGIAASTIWKILKRAGKSRLPQPERVPTVRYEREQPGELVHVDIKKLPRIGSVPGHRVTGNRSTQHRQATSGRGYDYVQICIDDRTRVTHAVFMDDEKTASCIAAFEQSVAWFAANGIRIERVLTDNGSGYKRRWTEACAALGITTKRTRPYRPETNGKAERLIQTLLREWAYGPTYQCNAERRSALPRYLDHYNTRRYHTSCKSTPWQRAASDLARVNNVRGHYT